MDYRYADLIKKYRTANKMTMEELSEVIERSKCSVNDYESGRTLPPREVLFKLAQRFNAPEFYAEYYNQDPVIQRLLPPITLNKVRENTAMRLMQAIRKLNPLSDELFKIAHGDTTSSEFDVLCDEVISEWLSLKLTGESKSKCS